MKDGWDKAKILGTLLIPLVIAISAYFLDRTIKQQDTNLKYLELAIGLIKEEPNEDTYELRLWAIDIVQKYSPVKLSDEALSQLKNSAIPDRDFWIDAEGKIIRGRDGRPILLKEP